MPGRQRWTAVGVVFVVAVTVRLAWALWAHVTPVSDFASYDALARRWLTTGQYRDGLGRAYRAPLYPVVLASIYGQNGELRAVALVQAILGAATAGLVTLLATTVVSSRASLVAGLVQALSPTAVVYVPILASENLAGLLSVALVLALSAVQTTRASRQRFLAAVAGGGLAGLLLLTRPAAVFMLPAWALLVIYSFSRRTWQPRSAGLFLLALAATLAPWLLRNARLGLGPCTLSTQGGVGLWWGNNPAERSGTGDGLQGFVMPRELSERERDAYYRIAAWDWIRAHPARYALLVRTRLLRMFGKEPDWVAARYLLPTAGNDRAMKTLAQVQEGATGVSTSLADQARVVQGRNLRLLRALRIVVAPLTALAIVLALPRWRRFAPILLPVAGYALGLALTIFDPRYRLLSDPLLTVLLAALLLDLVGGTRDLSGWPTCRAKRVLAACVVVASILVHAADLDRNWYRLPANAPADRHAAA